MSEWISVEAEMPEMEVDVLVFRPDAKKSNDPVVKVSQRVWVDNVNKSPQGVMHPFSCWCHVSHWMPLPEPPVKQG